MSYHSRLAVKEIEKWWNQLSLSTYIPNPKLNSDVSLIKWKTETVLNKEKPKFELRDKDMEIVDWKVKSLFFTYNKKRQNWYESKLYKITIVNYIASNWIDSKLLASNDEQEEKVVVSWIIRNKNIIIQECKSRKNIWRWYYLENYSTPFDKQEFINILKEKIIQFHENK